MRGQGQGSVCAVGVWGRGSVGWVAAAHLPVNVVSPIESWCSFMLPTTRKVCATSAISPRYLPSSQLLRVRVGVRARVRVRLGSPSSHRQILRLAPAAWSAAGRSWISPG